MAKRVRVSRSAHRPGGQGPTRARRPSDDVLLGPSAADMGVAAEDIGMGYTEVEVDEVAAAAIAAATASPPADPSADVTGSEPVGRRANRRRTSKRRTAEELTARAAAEDAWVRADLRRIGAISLVLLAVLAASWVVFGAMDVLGLY